MDSETRALGTAAANRRDLKWTQWSAWFLVAMFVAGFFYGPIGQWTGPVMGAWFVGTQKPWRGFVWMVLLNYLPGLVMDWKSLWMHGPGDGVHFAVWSLIACIAGVVPFTVHKVVSSGLEGAVSTLPLPLAAVGLGLLAHPLLGTAASAPGSVETFLIVWFAAGLVWMWNNGFRGTTVLPRVWSLGLIFGAAVSVEALLHREPAGFMGGATFSNLFAWCCLGALAALALVGLLRRREHLSIAEREELLGILRSPLDGAGMQVEQAKDREDLVSSSGQRFPVLDGIPDFRQAKDLTGDNGKYNHLYETIGGFYDDTQRVACALKGLNRDDYFLAYMRMLEVKPGDSVLETSVGTGLNLQYLPRGVKLFGLDLSAEMLASCRGNLKRWGLEADLVLGNAESLPFADASFDVVFHVGGISFFNDPGKAIREMIRVAKPGSLLLISDETEEYAKATYERMPIASGYYKNRTTTVKIPIDLVPAKMEETRLEMIKGGQFYAITFRKPAVAHSAEAGQPKIEA